jgi:hypothetical protein
MMGLNPISSQAVLESLVLTNDRLPRLPGFYVPDMVHTKCKDYLPTQYAV